MDIFKFLKTVENVELKMGEVYGRFSRDLAGDQEVSELFRKLTNDEESHRQIVQFEEKLVMQNRSSFLDLDIDVSGLPEEMAKIDEVMNSPQSFSAEQAIRFALDCEESVAELHFRKAIAISNPKISGLMKNLGDKDKEHLGYLQKFAGERGTL